MKTDRERTLRTSSRNIAIGVASAALALAGTLTLAGPSHAETPRGLNECISTDAGGCGGVVMGDPSLPGWPASGEWSGWH